MNSNLEAHTPTVTAVNENTVLLTFAEEISVQQAQRVANATAWIQKKLARYVIDCVPAYTTLLLYFDSERICNEKICALLAQSLTEWQREFIQINDENNAVRLVNIPVYYDPEVGPDLIRLAQSKALSIDELIQLHQETIYTVYTIGFAPGFAYMGNVDQRIAEARLATPRKLVAKGSVGIAGRQTGVYPQALPGGWNIIGRSPSELFKIDGQGKPRCPYKMGDQVKFYAIAREEFLTQGGEL